MDIRFRLSKLVISLVNQERDLAKYWAIRSYELSMSNSSILHLRTVTVRGLGGYIQSCFRPDERF